MGEIVADILRSCRTPLDESGTMEPVMTSELRLRASLVLVLCISTTAACGGDRAEPTPTTGSGPAATTGQGTGTGGGEGGAGGTQGVGGSGGSPGTGGAGGEGVGGSTTTGGGGQPSWDTCETPADCLGDQESVCPENACEDEDLFFDCEDGNPPVAYFGCVVAADVLRTNVWGRLVDCLRESSAAELCAGGADVVDACLAEGIARACANPLAVEACAAAAETCDDPGTFDLVGCEQDLAPYNEAGVGTYTGCLPQVEDVPCEERHALCVDVLLSF